MAVAETSALRPIAELLVENSRRQGGKTAFADDRRTVSWAELERRTGRLAVGLDVSRTARVAFCLDNSVELIEGLLATVRAGAVGAPLSARATDAELAQLLADCDPAALVTDRRNLPRLVRLTAGRPVRLLVTGDGPSPDGATGWEALVTESSSAPPDDLGLDEPAWLLYTSGTSGVSRAAVSSQRSALWSSAACYLPRLGLSAGDRILWPLPLSHTYAHSLCVLGTTMAGASARITEAPEPAALVRPGSPPTGSVKAVSCRSTRRKAWPSSTRRCGFRNRCWCRYRWTCGPPPRTRRPYSPTCCRAALPPPSRRPPKVRDRRPVPGRNGWPPYRRPNDGPC
ncbi:AMP-binding protein [Streptomyces sp. NPDC048254]|uniref:AMP-binding protein n=1 Tax=Streptomyces sp. NPDC048254 TaxID=3365525 RepID=UPI00371F7FD0